MIRPRARRQVMLERHGNKKTPFTVRTEKKVEVKVKKVITVPSAPSHAFL